jgi:hypothetical protein
MDLKVISGSVARTITAAAAGVLIAKGVPEEYVNYLVEPANQAIAGAILFAGAQAWSLIQKAIFKKNLLDKLGGRFKF